MPGKSKDTLTQEISEDSVLLCRLLPLKCPLSNQV